MTTTFDDSSEFVKEIRGNIADIMKQVDEFVALVEKQIKARENELDEKVRKYEVLKDKEKKLSEFQESLKSKEKVITKEKRAMRDKKLALDRKEEELQGKLERLKYILD